MKTLSAISVGLVTASVAAMGLPAFAGGLAAPSAPGSGDRAIVLAGGMGGGGAGMGGGGGAMGGGMRYFGGDPFGGPSGDFTQPARGSPERDRAPENYTYQCVTLVGRCSFVAPARLRANSLRSGADCGCGDGQDRGHVE